HIDIDKPIDEVVALYSNPDHMKAWMDGLQSFEMLTGEPGQPGSTNRFVFLMRGKEMEMIETIITANWPEEFRVRYDAKGVVNYVTSRFERLSDTRTRCYNEQDFEFRGFMKFIAWLMPGAFKKQSMK